MDSVGFHWFPVTCQVQPLSTGASPQGNAKAALPGELSPGFVWCRFLVFWEREIYIRLSGRYSFANLMAFGFLQNLLTSLLIQRQRASPGIPCLNLELWLRSEAPQVACWSFPRPTGTVSRSSALLCMTCLEQICSRLALLIL